MLSTPAVIAIVVFLAFVIICCVTMRRYSANDAIKVLSVFVGTFGIAFGSITTYFFTQHEIAAARGQAAAYRQQAEGYATNLSHAEAQLTSVRGYVLELGKIVATTPGDVKVAELKEAPEFQTAWAGLGFTTEESAGTNNASNPPPVPDLGQPRGE